MTGPIITLLSDFGTQDGYVAAMKGVILDLVPHAVLVDAGHDIRRHDVQAAGWALAQYAFTYPGKSIHIAVVDPGVGTSRELLLATAGEQYFLAPNNGLLYWVSRSASGFTVQRIREKVHRPEGKSATFHGRDILAYAAGRLASGFDTVERLTEPLEELVVPDWGEVRSEGNALVGEVIHVDHFGNVITNLHRNHVERTGWRRPTVRAGGGTISGIRRTYGDVRRGEPLALFGSHDHLEVAVSCGSAAESMGLRRGDPITVQEEGSA